LAGASLYERPMGTPAARRDGAMTPMLIGFGVTLGALVIQGVAVTFGVEAIGALMAKRIVGFHVWRNGVATLVLIVTLLSGHLAQMALWASAFMAMGEFQTFAVVSGQGLPLFPSSAQGQRGRDGVRSDRTHPAVLRGLTGKTIGGVTYATAMPAFAVHR
jgi:hypothetical protein